MNSKSKGGDGGGVRRKSKADADGDGGGGGAVRIKKKFRRADSGGSQRSSGTAGSRGSATKRWLSDSSDDDGGAGGHNDVLGSPAGSKGRKRSRGEVDCDGGSAKSPKLKKRSKDGKSAPAEEASLAKKKKKKRKAEAHEDGVPRRRHGKASLRRDWGEGAKKLGKRDLKPRLQAGDAVYAAWWPDDESRRTNRRSSWYPGKIKAVEEIDRGGDYGPNFYYDIEYEDGDELDGVAETYVLDKVGYQLDTRIDERTKKAKKWMGVTNMVDKTSADDWARVIGWYSAEIDGEEHLFSLLSEALRAYDNSVVRQKGSRTKPSHLNLPEEWKFPKKEEHDHSDTDSDHSDSAISISDLRGFTIRENGNNPEIEVPVKKGPRKRFYLGNYKLATDAAFAYDRALKLLKDANLKSPTTMANFSTTKEYRRLRAEEIRRTCLTDVDFETVQAVMAMKLEPVVKEVGAPSGTLLALDSGSEDDKPLRKKKKKKKEEKGKSPSEQDTTPDFNGVSFHIRNKRYQSKIQHGGSFRYLGQYKLAADAALAYDQALSRFKVENKEPNFASKQEHKKSRAAEMKRTGKSDIDLDSVQAAISSRLDFIVAEIGASAQKKPDLDSASDDDKPLAKMKTKEKNTGKSSRDHDQTTFTSKLKGIALRDGDGKTRKYQAQISYGGKLRHLGSYDLASDAALAYDEALRIFKGEYARTNFSSEQDHKNSRAEEMRRTGLNVDFDSIKATMSSKLDAIVKEVSASTTKEPDVDSSSDFDEPSKKSKKRNGRQSPREQKAAEPVSDPISDLKGFYSPTKGKFRAQVTAGGSSYYLGTYDLKSDAALAHDLAVKYLKNCGKINARTTTNFAAEQEHKSLRAVETRQTGLSVDFEDVQAYMTSKYDSFIAKIKSTDKKKSSVGPKKKKDQSHSNESGVETAVSRPKEGGSTLKELCPEAIALNKAMAEKWSKFLPTTTGAEFLDEYRRSIDTMFQDLTPRSENSQVPSTVSVGNELPEASRKDLTGHKASANRPQLSSDKDGGGAAAATSRGRNEREEAAKPDNFHDKVNGSMPSTVTVRNAVSVASRNTRDLPSDRNDVQSLDGSKTAVAQNIYAVSGGDPKPTAKSSSQDQNVGSAKARCENKDGNITTEEAMKPTEASSQEQNTGLPSKKTKCLKSHPTADEKPPPSSTNSLGPSSTTSSIARAIKKADLIQFTVGQVEEMGLPFPIGCSVWFNLVEANPECSDSQGQSFGHGEVTAVFLDRSASQEMLYQVKVEGAEEAEMLAQNDLCYAPTTSVNITPSSSFDPLPGEILMCRVVASKSYQDMIVQSVSKLKEALTGDQDPSNNQVDQTLLGVLVQLEEIDVSRPVLAETGIGKIVNKLAKSHGNSAVADKASALVERWKEVNRKWNAEKEQADSCRDTSVFLYTVLVMKGGNQICIEQNVSSDRVAFRKVATVRSEENESSNSTITTATGLC